MSRPIAIDTHHHIAPKLLRDAHKQRFEGKAFFQMKDISTAERLRYLDFAGIRTAVTSISIEPFLWQGPKAFEPSELAQFMQTLNDEQMDMVRAHPSRFGAFAALPLPNIEGTIAEIQRLTSQEGLKPDGFAVVTAHGGKYIGDPTFAPVLEELERLKAVVFVHPAETIMPPNLHVPGPILEFPFDTARAILSVIENGALIKYPNIRWIFSHMGGALPYILQRVTLYISLLPEDIKTFIFGPSPPSMILPEHIILALSGKIYFDTALANETQLEMFKVSGFDVASLTTGSDFPYSFLGDIKNEETWERLDIGKRTINAVHNGWKGVKEGDVEKMEYQNALQLFPRIEEQWRKEGWI